MSQAKYDKLTKSEKKKDDWMNSNWRPMMAVTYMITCLFDFVIGPVIYNVLQFYNPGQHLDMWQSLTLQGGGLYHIAMGAVLGIAAHGRTQEKIKNPMPFNTPFSFGGGTMTEQSTYSQRNGYQSYDYSQNQYGYQPYEQPNRPAPAIASNKFGKVIPTEDDPIL